MHGDVFRPPNQLTLFCALVGTGSQLAIMVFSMILFATLTTLYVGRGAIVVSFLIAYSATALFGGYASGALFSRMGGRTWIRTMLYTVRQSSVHPEGSPERSLGIPSPARPAFSPARASYARPF